MCSVLLLLLSLSHARAPEPAEAPTDPPAASAESAEDTDGDTSAEQPDANDKAEYVRLSQEIRRLVERDHWQGVEHAYVKAMATGVPLSFGDHMAGYSAALNRGDVATARERLLAAKALDEMNEEVIEGLWGIDTAFAPVDLKADPGSELAIDTMPFNPQHAEAVRYAQGQLAETGVFEGYLPAGEYTLGSESFTLEVRDINARPVEVDVRSDKVKGKAEKG